MESFSYGTTPEELIKECVKEQCPNGYPMTIKDQDEWSVIATCVNVGIDAHLEALTNRSRFANGDVLVHPEELHVLLRRLNELEFSSEEEFDAAISLRKGILKTLDIEEV